MHPSTPEQTSAVSRATLAVHATIAARRLLGHILLHVGRDGRAAAGRIVEVEAYRQSDPACHAFGGKTARNAQLFSAPGHAYVYRSYGLHWCVNVSCEAFGVGAAVLIRALVPLTGLPAMRARRGPHIKADHQLCRGPGNVCAALGIDHSHDGLDLLDPAGPLRLLPGTRVAAREILRGPRIGISKAKGRPWRLWIRQERAVSGRLTASPTP